ncbi:hypothetical protein PIB30_070567 [Stylosanthes scabra]|uniref:Uncharacterized protein n=1 Tax=Stylosanthes scabra TaxID=79078 RepID=A0ABU6SPU6_9FABA|nr:hypothetical protein [Stylosanthes scabra]
MLRHQLKTTRGARTRHSDIRPFCPLRDKASLAPSTSVENCHPPERCPYHRNQDEVDNTYIEDKDYVLDADELAPFDDHIDNIFANHDAAQQNKGKKHKDTDWWDVEEAIQEIEGRDQSSEELSQNDSLAQQGDKLPPNIAAKMNSLGSGPSSVDSRDLQGQP